MAQPTTAGRYAVADDFLLKTYFVEALNNDGYINLPTVKPIEEDFTKDVRNQFGKARTGGRLRKEKWEQYMREAEECRKRGEEPDPNANPEEWLKIGEPFHIHPALQEERWKLDLEGDWKLILPSVELVSRIIDDPDLQPFFHGIMANVWSLNDPILNARHQAKFQQWNFQWPNRKAGPWKDGKPRETSAYAEESFHQDTIAVFHQMINMKKYVTWQFAHVPFATRNFGETQWNTKLEKCVVRLNHDFLDILRNELNIHDFSKPWTPGTDADCARLRTLIILAITIVHEFAHCVWFQSNRSFKPDPYLRGRPVNELGYELENFVFSGVMSAIGAPPREAAPYGIKMDMAGRAYLIPTTSPQCASHVELQEIGATVDKWHQMARFGIRQLRPERKKGVRTWYRGPPVKRDRSLSPPHGFKNTANWEKERDLQFRRRINAMNYGTGTAVPTSDLDRGLFNSDTDDEGSDGFVIRGSRKNALHRSENRASTKSKDVVMGDD